MKHLFIIRHAKSSWDDPTQRDFDRPLNKRGEHDAPLMANLLNQQAEKPQFIVSSPALRALSTAKVFASALNIGDSAFLLDKRIYEATVYDLLEVIQQIPEHVHSAAIFGHNPGLSQLVDHLSDDYVDMATCSIVYLTIMQDNWAMATQNCAVLKDCDYPKKHLA